MPDDDFKTNVLDHQTKVVPPPFTTECKAAPPGSPITRKIQNSESPVLDKVLTDDHVPSKNINKDDDVLRGLVCAYQPNSLSSNKPSRDELSAGFPTIPYTSAETKGIPGLNTLKKPGIDPSTDDDLLVGV